MIIYVESTSEKGKFYAIRKTPQGWRCECPNFVFNEKKIGYCKHIKSLVGSFFPADVVKDEREQAKEWLHDNWERLSTEGKLVEALKRFYERFIIEGNKVVSEGYKNSLESNTGSQGEKKEGGSLNTERWVAETQRKIDDSR